MKVRPARTIGGLTYIPLTQGYEAIVDDEFSALVTPFNWRAAVSGENIYAVRWDASTGKRVLQLMHRIVLSAPPGIQVDHINGNGLDNRIKNLRLATNQQNSQNQRITKRNSSGYKGVSWCAATKKWKAMIWVDKSPMYLGVYSNIEKAAEVYAEASKRFHREFGRTK